MHGNWWQTARVINCLNSDCLRGGSWYMQSLSFPAFPSIDLTSPNDAAIWPTITTESESAAALNDNSGYSLLNGLITMLSIRSTILGPTRYLKIQLTQRSHMEAKNTSLFATADVLNSNKIGDPVQSSISSYRKLWMALTTAGHFDDVSFPKFSSPVSRY